MRGVFGWGDERIAHYLESVQEQTGWSRELVLQDAEHACDEGPEALEPWRADAYLGPVPADPELAEIETMVCSKLRAVAWSDEEIVRWQRNIQRINRWSREQALREAQAMAFALSEDNVSPEVWETPEEIARSAAFEAWSAECREMNAALAKAHKVYVNAPPPSAEG